MTVRRTEDGFTAEVDAGHFLLDRYDFDWGDSGARHFRPLQESGRGKPFHSLAAWRRKASYGYDPDGRPRQLQRLD